MKARIARNRRRQGGAALAEYGLLVAGIVLVSLVAVSVLGGKVGGLIGSVATLLPGAYTDQNAPVHVGEMIETKTGDINNDGVKEITLDTARIADEGGAIVGGGSASGPDLGDRRSRVFAPVSARQQDQPLPLASRSL